MDYLTNSMNIQIKEWRFVYECCPQQHNSFEKAEKVFSLCQTKDQDPDWKDSLSVCPLLHIMDLYVNEG